MKSPLLDLPYAVLIECAARHRLLTAGTFFPRKRHLVMLLERAGVTP